MNKAFLFCGTCTQSWKDQLDLTEKATFLGFFGYISGTHTERPLRKAPARFLFSIFLLLLGSQLSHHLGDL